MNKEIKEFCNKVWNEEARRQLEAELNFMSKEKIELPKGKDYLELFAKTHKTDEEIMEEKDKEIDRLNNIINELEKWLEDKIYTIEPKGTGINYNCEYDSEEDYIDAMREQSRLNTLKENLDKLKELKENK